MTRIIAGAAGRVLLTTPRAGTRPTSDRVREALFSTLEARDAIEGARVLDLYAGTGALGLEAASRGAANVVLVEKSPAAAAVCRANAAAVAAALRAAGRADAAPIDVRAGTVAAYLAAAAGPFDLVFSDPPYDVDEATIAADLRALAPLLGPDALVVVERSVRSPSPAWPDALTPSTSKRYGDTVLHLAEAVGPGSAGHGSTGQGSAGHGSESQGR